MAYARRLLGWFRKRLFFQINLRKDTPHRIAMGVAIGVFVSITPTVGFQPFLAFVLSFILNANKLIAIGVTVLSNPLTFLPIFYPSFLLGRYLLGQPARHLYELVPHQGHESWWGFLEGYYLVWTDLFYPILIGSVLFSLILCPVVYLITRQVVIYYRHPRSPGSRKK